MPPKRLAYFRSSVSLLIPGDTFKLWMVAVLFPFFSRTPLSPFGAKNASTFQPSSSHFGVDASTSMDTLPNAFSLVTIGSSTVFGISTASGGGAGATGGMAGGVGFGAGATGD